MIELNITKNDENQRLDRFVKKYLNDAPKSFIYKMIRKKNIKVNDNRTSIDYFLKEGDIVKLYISDSLVDHYRNQKMHIETNLKLDIIYEDENIVLINKPKGISVQPAQNGTTSLLDILLSGIEFEETDTFRPAFCNRLDKNTTGIIIAAKNYEALKQVNKSIKERNIRKIYHTIVFGKIDKKIEIEGFLQKQDTQKKVTVSRHKKEGFKAITTIVVPKISNDLFTEIEVDLVTGRTHQIRAHLQHIGHPLVGDLKYGGKYKQLSSQFLHAACIRFLSIGGAMDYLNGRSFFAPPPLSYQQLKNALFSEK
ncbi:MAG: Pseudouridine synthase [Clostridiales bacterium 38_11]|nr:MAG: Pseudouridine synthase [Clostridiales bacterium 38_11]HBH12083.1 RNA pseudouridine synthase [Clostridiales bacterium]